VWVEVEGLGDRVEAGLAVIDLDLGGWAEPASNETHPVLRGSTLPPLNCGSWAKAGRATRRLPW
jgi:hypothetical protein